MSTAIIIVGSVILSILFMGVVTKVTLGVLTTKMGPRVDELLKDSEIVKRDLTAMSFGQQSKGKLQGRGNGALVLTTREIVFLRAVMPTELRIPLGKVTKLSFVHSHLGKATPYKLLKIEFDGDAGEDSIAFFTENPQEFWDEIEKARAKAA